MLELFSSLNKDLQVSTSQHGQVPVGGHHHNACISYSEHLRTVHCESQQSSSERRLATESKFKGGRSLSLDQL